MGQMLAGYRRVAQDVNEALWEIRSIVDNLRQIMIILCAATLIMLLTHVFTFCYNCIPAIMMLVNKLNYHPSTMYYLILLAAVASLVVIAGLKPIFQQRACIVIAVLIGAHVLVTIGCHLKKIEVLFVYYVFRGCKALLVASGGLAVAHFLFVYVNGVPNMEVIQRDRELAARQHEIDRERVRQQRQPDGETLTDEPKKCPKMQRQYSSQQNIRHSQQQHSLPQQQKPKRHTLPRSASDMEMRSREWRY